MQINKNTKLLVISPHPDDEALGVGGLIGKVKKEKGSVHIVYMCVGNSRQLVTRETKTNIRKKEIQDVEKLIGENTTTFYEGEEFTRLDVVPQKDLIEKIENVVTSYKPTIMVIPFSTSYNQDHRATFTACITALRPTPKSVRHAPSLILEYFEPYFWSVEAQKAPNVYVDLSETYNKGDLLDFKIALYKCHKTQVREDPFPRSINNLKAQARMFGKEIGIEIAEAYHLLRYEL